MAKIWLACVADANYRRLLVNFRLQRRLDLVYWQEVKPTNQYSPDHEKRFF